MNPAITNSLPHSVRVLSSDLNAQQAESAAGAHAGSGSEVNTPLVKEIVRQLEMPDTPDKLENIQRKFVEYGLDTRAQDFESSKTYAALQRSVQAFKEADPEGKDAAESMVKQQDLVNTAAKSVDDIRTENRNTALNAKRSYSQISAALIKAQNDNEKNNDGKDQGINTGTSYAELWKRISLAIGEIKTDYVDFYADLMQKYTEMYQSFNEKLLKASSEVVSAGSDGNNVKFDISKMNAGYTAFEQDTYKLRHELGSIKNWDRMTDAGKASMKTTLEPAFNVDNNGKISFNLVQYEAVYITRPSGIKNGQVSTASYHAWLATFNASGSALQSNMQSFAQRYSQANSTFDNLNKVLSGAISSLADSAKDVLKSLT